MPLWHVDPGCELLGSWCTPDATRSFPLGAAVYALVTMHRFDVHRIFLGRNAEMSNYQIRVYGSPRVKAISTIEPDKEKAQTAIVVALSQAFDTTSRNFLPVYLFVPEERFGWLCVQVEEMAKALVKRLRSESTAENKELTQKTLRVLREWLSQVHPGSPSDWMSVAPDRWTAFGYTSNDPIPPWVKTTLG